MRRLALCAATLCVVALVVVYATASRAHDATRVVWVFFRESAAHSDAPPAVSAYTLEQRRIRGIASFPNDAPIPASLIARVAGTGAHIREQSRWLRAVSVEADSRALRRILAMPEVARIHDVGSMVPADASGPDLTTSVSDAPRSANAAVLDSAYYGQNWPGIRQLGIPIPQQFGFDGTGIRIALFDTGFERAHAALSSRTVFAQRDFINKDNVVANQATDTGSVDQEVHGTRVWSILGGFEPGQVVGPAYNAQFLLAKIENQSGHSKQDEDRWVAAMEWADSLGAKIINSSVAFRIFVDRPFLPYDSLDGDAYVVTRAADEAARRGILVVQAMGDAASPVPGTLSAPADGDSIIAVGSVDRFGNPAVFNPLFTSRGPTADGRIKPELVALGIGLKGANSATQVGYDSPLAGTSYSTAFISGVAAMFLQAWPETPPMGVRRALLLAANRATHPDNNLGWGLTDVGGAILFPEGISLNTLNPIDLSGAVTSIAPTFSWTTPLTNSSNFLHPITFNVQAATDTGFTNIVFSDTVREAQSLTARTALPAVPRLFWRVVATTPVGITRASLRDLFRVPDWVKLLTLAGDQTTFSATTQPQLTWVPLDPRAAGPFTYDVQILAHGTGEVVQTLRNLTSSTVRVTAPLTPNQSYRWRVIARARTGQVDTVQSGQPFVVSTDDKPPATILYQNFPNPFPNAAVNDVTRIWFDLATDGPVVLTVHDTRGNIVKRLIPARGCPPVMLSAGIYGRTGQALDNEQCTQLSWDGTNDNGSRVASGVYVLQLRAGGKVLAKKILFTPNR